MKLKPVTGSSYSVTLAGAYDRNYNSTKTAEGNIYNNKAESYDVVFLDEENTVQCRGKLDEPEVKEDKRLYKFEKTEGTVPVMYADATGNIYTASGKRVRLGIRPESAERAYPGDDLIPAFQAVYTSLSDGSIKHFDFQAKDSDYIAVYDKKLLWRANLYIEQKESALGDIDWNNAHPWNVPPADGVAQEGVCPKSWSDSWGYNEWNRKQDGKTLFKCLSDLSAGNGGQGIELASFTPLRTVSGTMSVLGVNNKLYNTVAYSYPLHEYESKEGDAGSMDSPFDFNKKMIIQKKQLKLWYSSNTTRSESSSDENRWNSFTAPNDMWWHYEISSMQGFDAMFVPSLGLKIASNANRLYSDAYDENIHVINGVTRAMFINQSTSVEAGTDCIGFVQRCASYKVGTNENNYGWKKLPAGWTEYSTNGTNSIYDQQTSYENNRIYPIDERSTLYSSNIVSRICYDIQNGVAVQSSNPKPDISALKKIVPGDIFVKDSTNDDDSEMANHIAMVASVPDNTENITDAEEYMEKIILIESTFGACIQSVIKLTSLADYNNNNFVTTKKIYPEYTIGANSPNFSFYCQAWAIRRLK